MGPSDPLRPDAGDPERHCKVRKAMKSIEELTKEGVPLKEVELMLTEEELKAFAAYCIEHDLKFNDWIRALAHEALNR